jgi:ATP-dependent HslUV protease ATP-binding subunit HslU
LKEPDNSLLKQYCALMLTEGLNLVFDDDAIDAMADAAWKANTSMENIGARRLHTVLERVLEELSFEASELGAREVRITAQYVHDRVDKLLEDQDLSRHILSSRWHCGGSGVVRMERPQRTRSFYNS